MDNMSNATTASLTRPRASIALLTLAAAVAVGYSFYHIHNEAAAFPELTHSSSLRRSNAVRHRRRSVPDVLHHNNPPESQEQEHEHQHQHDDDHAESEGSWTSQEEPAIDENNLDHNPSNPLAETVVDEEPMQDDWWNDTNTFQRAGQNIVALLFRVSEDNSHRTSYVHRGCQCNACGIVPIRGIRYRCANCADFDLCETCESAGNHYRTHVFYKIKIPLPRLGSRHMQPVWYPVDPINTIRMLPKNVMAKLGKETGYERPELEALWEQWTFMANSEWRDDPDGLHLAMDRPTFERFLFPSDGNQRPVPSLLLSRIFSFYDTDNNGMISFREFLHATAFRKRKDRGRRIFEGYDIDGDGYISRQDCLRLFRAYYTMSRQMHRGVVDGVYDQAINNPDARQYVTSRQPLSGSFGREGAGFPQAQQNRQLQGKVEDPQIGEVCVSDGDIGAVKGNELDTADRQELLTRLFTTTPSDALETLSERDALMQPPITIEELPAILTGENRELVILSDTQEHEESDEEGTADDSAASNNLSGQGDTSDVPSAGYSTTGGQPDGIENGSPQLGDADLVRGDGFVLRAGGSNQEETGPSPRRRSHPVSKAGARRKLLDRWLKRMFYLDEEEGVTAPEGFQETDDVLSKTAAVAESSKAAQHASASARSRSPSGVRFTEDGDEPEMWSNRSTSGKIPERRGGMEISGAERDAGKEIFYQVLQQGMNEILDILFKENEELALKAAKTKKLREANRELLNSRKIIDASEAARSHAAHKDPSLDQLLARSGYTIDESLYPVQEGESIAFSEVGRSVGDQPGEDGAHREDGVRRDPTMPQFRPDGSSRVTPDEESEDAKQEGSDKGKAAPTAGATADATAADTRSPPSKATRIWHSTLMEWKKLDRAEEEAKKRGGWGRINYTEFEKCCNTAGKDNYRLEFLGSWIDSFIQ